jgi:hypothetical protein
MDALTPDQFDRRPDLVSRRRLLWLAGSVGLATTVSACSGARPAPNPTATAAPSATTTTSPPPAPMASTTPTPTVAASDVILCRDAWGARPPKRGGTPHTITGMTIHHTAVVLGDNSNAPARLRQHQHYHQDQQGWVDIAYHVGVDRNGNIFELRSTDIAGDTATSYDPVGHFLVVCEGNFDEEEVSEEQLQGAALAFAWAAQTFSVATDTLAGHRDVSGDTACPGASLYAHVSSGGLKSRIDEMMAAGTVNLRLVCGPEAAAKVADIEAGR